ncbi:MAG: 50S ribosomal protein P1 [Candidatus Diapherotrites archaeon CG08_land_8_20_14_0_20_34_12]|nr:MAG: 50S ribosomal protein P1 [Candidatus Diapherotrites archaeon CG08_land_8_20_14_0_20_34_12]
MEYIYSALLLHSTGKPVEEAGVKKVLEAAGVQADTSKIKALVASLKDVNIDEAIKKASIVQVAAPAAAASAAPAKEEKKVDEKKTEEEAASGLSALFG